MCVSRVLIKTESGVVTLLYASVATKARKQASKHGIANDWLDKNTS